MISRRSVILSAGAFCLSFAGLPAAQAADPRFLEDLLHGVSDALIRDYIRKHCCPKTTETQKGYVGGVGNPC